MYPKIEFFDGWITIYTFGLFLSVAFVVFFWLLHRLSGKMGITEPVFQSLIAFSIGVIISGRIFYMMAEWSNQKFHFSRLFGWESNILGFLKDIFIMQNYNLSLMGGILWFFIVFFIKTRHEKTQNIRLYLDVIVVSFLAASVIGYIGAFLWGQVYGRPVWDFIGISYTHPDSIVPFTSPIFPLPIFYALGNLILFSVCIFLRKKYSQPGFIWGVGMSLFWALLLVGEFFNGSEDIFLSFTHLHLNQIGAIILIFIGLREVWWHMKV